MQAQNPKTFAFETVSKLLEIARDCPDEFPSYFCGAIITNVAGNLTGEQFAGFNDPKPCGVVGCDCYLRFAALGKALAELREDHKNHCPPPGIAE